MKKLLIDIIFIVVCSLLVDCVLIFPINFIKRESSCDINPIHGAAIVLWSYAIKGKKKRKKKDIFSRMIA